jgi:hypothetical protein
LTEENCKKLEQVYRKLLQWTKRYRMKFALRKYELIYFTRYKRFNLQAGIQIKGIEKASKERVYILGIWVDPKLKWSVY